MNEVVANGMTVKFSRIKVIFVDNMADILLRLMLYTRLALPVAVCIAKRGRNTRLAWIANPNPNPNPNPTNPIV